MERETYRRLPEVVAARGDPPAPSSVPPLKEQGDYCASRGMDYLAAFWKELTEPEKRQLGGRATLDAWKKLARAADAASRPAPPPSPVSPDDPEAVEIEERAGMAQDSVPAAYLDAWARLQARKPGEVSDAEWQQAIADGGLFLDQWAKIAVNNGWTDRDLFDAPCKGVPGGLVWFLRGVPVPSLGPWHASIGEGYVVFDKRTRRAWQNPYVLPCETLQ